MRTIFAHQKRPENIRGSETIPHILQSFRSCTIVLIVWISINIYRRFAPKQPLNSSTFSHSLRKSEAYNKMECSGNTCENKDRSRTGTAHFINAMAHCSSPHFDEFAHHDTYTLILTPRASYKMLLDVKQ